MPVMATASIEGLATKVAFCCLQMENPVDKPGRVLLMMRYFTQPGALTWQVKASHDVVIALISSLPSSCRI